MFSASITLLNGSPFHSPVTRKCIYHLHKTKLAVASSDITNLDSAYTVTIGAGGAGGVNGNGGNGGGSSFGSITAGGGFGGGSGNGVPPIIQNSTGIPRASGGNILNLSGENPTIGMAISTSAIISGGGGNSPLGVGGNPHGSAGIGVLPTGFGAGGGGANAYVNNATQYNGAAGGNGIVLRKVRTSP